MKTEIVTDDRVPLIKMMIAAAAGAISGLTLNEWVAVLTLVYLIAQIGLLIPQYWAAFKKWWQG